MKEVKTYKMRIYSRIDMNVCSCWGCGTGRNTTSTSSYPNSRRLRVTGSNCWYIRWGNWGFDTALGIQRPGGIHSLNFGVNRAQHFMWEKRVPCSPQLVQFCTSRLVDLQSNNANYSFPYYGKLEKYILLNTCTITQNYRQD